jgi:hypothetical protein
VQKKPKKVFIKNPAFSEPGKQLEIQKPSSLTQELPPVQEVNESEYGSE